MKSKEVKVGIFNPLGFTGENLDDLWRAIVGAKLDKKEKADPLAKPPSADEIISSLRYLQGDIEPLIYLKDGKKVGLVISSHRISLCSKSGMPVGIILPLYYYYDPKYINVHIILDNDQQSEFKIREAIFFLENKWNLPVDKLRQTVATALNVDIEGILAYI